jgi:hypothetical protein
MDADKKYDDKFLFYIFNLNEKTILLIDAFAR